MTIRWDEEFDIVVVGSGAGGLAAAITAENRGMKTLVIEKMDKWGGSSSYSGGGVWVPNNYLMLQQGTERDSPDEALTYLKAVVGEVGPASSLARKKAFVKYAPEMVLFLKDMGFKWMMDKHYPDYYPLVSGAKCGRTLEGKAFNAKKLGKFRKTQLYQPGMPLLAITADDAQYLPLATQTWKAFMRTSKAFAKTVIWRLTGRIPLTSGKTLVGQLMHILQSTYHTPVWLNSPLKDLITENNRVVGIIVEKEGKLMNIKAGKGVMLASGGFAQNDSFRRQFQPVGSEWTSSAPGNTGDSIQAGRRMGTALALMEEAWWGGSFKIGGAMAFSVWERSYPGTIMVDTLGERYANESTSYVDLGRAMLDRHAKIGGAVPSWLIMDGKHRKKYLFGQFPGGITPSKYIKDGTFIKANTLDELAEKCGINAVNLKKTIGKFNAAALSGMDEEFGRGNDIYDRYYGDYRVKPNNNLAPIENSPFWAIRIYPGDLGTKGGFLTDEYGRVLHENGAVIKGLYASGNDTASVMGKTYPGAGGSLAPACTFSYIAMNHAATEMY